MKRNLESTLERGATQGGVTGGRIRKGERSDPHAPQGRRHGGRHSGFRKSVLLRGRRRNEGLGHLDKPTATCSQKERRRAARRKRLQFFRGSGMVTKNARRGIEEGSSRNAGALHSSPPASKGSGRPSQGGISGVSLAGSRKRTLSAESFWLAADALPPRRQLAANARERQAPRGARRSDAGEDIGARWVCPYVESSLQKSVGGNGLKKRSFPTFCLTARE